MSAALQQRTKDGAPSVAFLIEQDQPAFGTERADAATVTAWAKANGVKLDGSGSQLARVNSARFAAGLPGFVLIPAPAAPTILKKAPVAPGPRPASGALAQVPAQVAPVFSSTPAPPSSHRTIRSEAELIDLVSDFDGTVTVRCGKDLAGWLWALNTSNRPLNKTQVERFRKLLRDGQFLLTGEAVIVSKQGTINDGQHRIKAILDTGIEAPIDIRFGIEKAAFAATGTGARRTLGNVLAIAGQPNAGRVAAIARLVSHYDAATMASSNQAVEPHIVLAIVEREAQIAAVAAWCARAKFAPARTAPIGLVLAVAARAHPLDRVLEFADLIDSGLAPDTSPARLLHIRLRDAALSRSRLHQTEIAALGVRAFNAWAADKPMQRLALYDGDRSNEGFPQVVAP